MNTKKIYNELKEMLCNQDKALKELVWTVARNEKLDRPKNVLLVGEVGTGKSTMVECVANKMNKSLAKVSGLCTSNGMNPKVLYDAFLRLHCSNEDGSLKGIVLIEDMRNCFIYGGFSDISSLINSGSFSFNKNFFDLTSTMFIGEIDTNGLEECFTMPTSVTIDNIEDAFILPNYDGDEIKNIIEDLICLADDIDNPVDMYSDKYRDAIKRTFLSIECNKVFGKKIFAESMKREDICNALKSPISELQTYSDDLCEEYMHSDYFINSIANHISESLIGLHDLDNAVKDVTRFDSKRKIKVYKEDSLMGI